MNLRGTDLNPTKTTQKSGNSSKKIIICSPLWVDFIFCTKYIDIQTFLSDLSVQKYPNTFDATIYQIQGLNNVKALAGKTCFLGAVHAEHVLKA